MADNGYVKAYGISYAGTLPKIRKADDQLQPVYEGFTNALESLRLAGEKTGSIKIRLNHAGNMFSKEKQEYDFISLTIEDSGIGFNDTEFDRLKNLNDTSKAFFNKGSGRIQYLHYFDKTEYSSIYKDANSSTGFKQRTFVLSKSEPFLKQNAIIKLESEKDISAQAPTTILNFKLPLSDKDLKFYRELSLQELKEKIITRYLAYFCENRDKLPEITLQHLVDGNILEPELRIESTDIPEPDQQRDILVSYSRFNLTDRQLEKSDKTETFNLKAFKVEKNQLQKNGLKLVSKGEIAKEIKLESLLPDEYIDGKRYLFLLSGLYISNRDSDTRGELTIPTLEEFKKTYGFSDSLFDSEEILLEDIQSKANDTILNMYEEIRAKIDEKRKNVEELAKMFNLDGESIKEAKISINDSDEKILEKIYQIDAKAIARKDAEIKKRIDALDHLNPASVDFEAKLQQEIEELAKAIPMQNKATLAHYVARRKLVLELFDKILAGKLTVQKTTPRRLDEKLVHNLLFQQSSNDPGKSDLWIINEDFIYFKGISESRLFDIKIDGKKIFKKEFSQEEERYLKSLGENRKLNALMFYFFLKKANVYC